MLIKPQSTSSLPLNWDAIFPEKNPLAVEIGFGNGKFLKTLETIGANVVGFEVSLLSVEKAMKVIDHTKTALLLMDGIWASESCFRKEA